MILIVLHAGENRGFNQFCLMFQLLHGALRFFTGVKGAFTPLLFCLRHCAFSSTPTLDFFSPLRLFTNSDFSFIGPMPSILQSILWSPSTNRIF